MQLAHLPHLPRGLDLENVAHWIRQQHVPTAALFLFYVVPLSALPPLIFYYAGTHFDMQFSGLNEKQMAIIASVFYAAELVMSFILAGFIEGIGNAAFRIMHTRYEMLDYPTPDQPSEGILLQLRKVDFRDAYTLAAISPTPLWLVSFALFIPNLGVMVTLGAFALMLSLYILYAATPFVLKIEGKGEGILMGWILWTVGIIGWAAMMYLTFITWGYVAGFTTG